MRTIDTVAVVNWTGVMSVVRAIYLRLLRLRGRPELLVAQARRLAGRGKYLRAIRLLARAARAGSSKACLELGRAYLFGEGLPSCPAAAMQWLTRAALGGETEAQFMIASLALQGMAQPGSGTLFELASCSPDGIPDYRAALHWTQIAAAAGYAPSQALLGFILTSGPQVLRDTSRGNDCYRMAAEAGCAHGQIGWSLVLLRTDPVANIIEVRRLLAEAARANMPIAHYLLGGLVGSDDMGATHSAAAADHYRAGAQLGHAPSQLAYGLALLNGDGLDPDVFLGESWIRRAALAGDAQAEATLGALYGKAGSLPPNFAEAMLWFSRAAASGHNGAARALAKLHLQGDGVGSDPRAAMRVLRTAAENGDQSAGEELAALVLAHAGSAEAASSADCRFTLNWFQEIAARGDPAAAYNVGLCCSMGVGMEADDAAALVWFRVAANHLSIAQYSCGRMLAEGRGVVQDFPAARKFLLQAADNGLPEAAALAGEMLLNGRGGPRDAAGAKALFRQAADAGHLGALYGLGVMALGFYDEPKDLQAAETFLRRAAELGHPAASAALSSYMHCAPVGEIPKRDTTSRVPLASPRNHAGFQILAPAELKQQSLEPA